MRHTGLPVRRNCLCSTAFEGVAASTKQAKIDIFENAKESEYTRLCLSMRIVVPACLQLTQSELFDRSLGMALPWR